MPTDEIIYNGIGTQSGMFETSQNFWCATIGPSWSRPLGSGRLDLYLMDGKAIAKATSSGAWTTGANVGSDPGSSHVSIVLSGATWSPQHSRAELGADFFASGPVTFWDNPAVTVDLARNHVKQTLTTSITGIAIRAGFRFGYRVAAALLECGLDLVAVAATDTGTLTGDADFLLTTGAPWAPFSRSGPPCPRISRQVQGGHHFL
jgi:hypothetical protein